MLRPFGRRMAALSVSFTLNGSPVTVEIDPAHRLLDTLRYQLALTGTKEGCGEGECGACTVLLAGRSVNSCLVPAVQADGARIVTVEGLARGRSLSALQRAFAEMGGAQCGICTPGMLISAHELLARSRRGPPDEDAVRDSLAGNLCRCTGYQKIVDAVRAAAAPEFRLRPARRGFSRRSRETSSPGERGALGGTRAPRRGRRSRA